MGNKWSFADAGVNLKIPDLIPMSCAQIANAYIQILHLTCITQYRKRSAAGNVKSAVSRTKTAAQARPEVLAPNAEQTALATQKTGTKSDRFAAGPITPGTFVLSFMGRKTANLQEQEEIMIQGISYLSPLLDEMARHWPNNRTINIVCHGHSVPAGYFATPYVNTFDAYPHLLHKTIKERFPFAVTNVIVTAIGGENSAGGAERFERDVLPHRPDVLTIDYSLNDRGIGLDRARSAWESMIQSALSRNIKVILCTPTWDNTYYEQNEAWQQLVQHAGQVRALADRYEIALADNFRAFARSISEPADLVRYLSHGNHPSKAGHQLAAQEIAKYFVAR